MSLGDVKRYLRAFRGLASVKDLAMHGMNTFLVIRRAACNDDQERR
jgi:hypothetical protein